MNGRISEAGEIGISNADWISYNEGSASEILSVIGMVNEMHLDEDEEMRIYAFWENESDADDAEISNVDCAVEIWNAGEEIGRMIYVFHEEYCDNRVPSVLPGHIESTCPALFSCLWPIQQQLVDRGFELRSVQQERLRHL